MEISRLVQDGIIAEPVSRDQSLRRERGQGNIHFSCSANHEQDWQPRPVDPYSCYMLLLLSLLSGLNHTQLYTYVVANPVRGHKEVPRSTGHIMLTTRYLDQQGSKSRQNIMRLYKQWRRRSISKRFIKPAIPCREQPRSTRTVVAYPRPAFSATDQQVQVFQGHTRCLRLI